MKTNETTPVFQKRTLFFIASIVTGIVSEAIIIFATPLMILDITGSPSSAGFAFAIEWLPAVLMYPFAGVIADRFGGIRVFWVAACIRALTVLISVALIVTLPSLAIPVLLINAAIMSALMAPNRMAVEKLVPQLVGKKNLATIQAIVQNSELIAWTLGPAIGAFLVVYTSKTWLLGLTGVTFIASSLPILFIRTQQPEVLDRAARGVASLGRELMQGVSLLFGTPPLIRLAFLNCTINLAFAVSLGSHAAIITTQFNMADSAYGIMNSISGGLGFLNLLMIPLMLRRIDIYSLGQIGLAIVTLGLFASSLVNSYTPYLVSFAFASIGVALFNVYNRTQRIKAVPKEHIGKVMGPFYVLNLMAMPIGGVLVGLFANEYGNQAIILSASISLAVIGPILLIASQKLFVKQFSAMELKEGVG